MDCTGLLIFVFFGKSSDCFNFLLIVLVSRFGVTTCSDTRLYEFHYVNLSMNWNEAQRYCRENYTDLVTIESADDLTRLNRPSLGTLWSWIGLTDDPKSWKGVMGNDSNSWRWSATGTTSETDYQNWAYNEPNYARAQENCVFTDNGKWLDVICRAKKQFVCFNGKKITIMLLVISAV
uniref:C-type lectin domain-containing protein n=1 Tax=Seriola dumerili TaxID=41447 RepID=A0A3B4U2W9_SERDU